jgi:hypothetical protein
MEATITKFSYLCKLYSGRIPGSAGNRAIRLYLFLPAAKKGYRSYPLRCSKTASVPFLSCKFFARQKTYGIITAGLRAGRFWFCGVYAARKLLGIFGGVWGFAPNSENQNAQRFGSPRFLMKKSYRKERIPQDKNLTLEPMSPRRRV